MLRRTITLLTILSMVVGLSAGLLWVRSFRSCDDRLSLRLGGARYALRSEAGSLRVLGPPRNSSKMVEELAAKMSNRDIVWSEFVESIGPFDREGPYGPDFGPSAQASNPIWKLATNRRAPAERAMLGAMEDPDRFVAAHWVLCTRAGMRGSGAKVTADGDSKIETWNKLRAQFYPDLAEQVETVWHPPGAPDSSFDEKTTYRHYRGEPSVKIDPSQRIMLRDFWHDQFDVGIVSCPYRRIVLVAMVLPLFACMMKLKKLRRTPGLCPVCGYDLRATPDQCPECGNGRR